jgi:hypothetical protein
MKKLKLSNLTIDLVWENSNVEVKTSDGDALLLNQTEEQVSSILEHNYSLVYNFYKLKCTNYKFDKEDSDDISHISLRIVLFYLYMYNSWRLSYKKGGKYENLEFKNKDFSNPSTIDIIIRFYKTRFPDQWKSKCIKLLDFTIEQLDNYWHEREKFYNK